MSLLHTIWSGPLSFFKITSLLFIFERLQMFAQLQFTQTIPTLQEVSTALFDKASGLPSVCGKLSPLNLNSVTVAIVCAVTPQC